MLVGDMKLCRHLLPFILAVLLWGWVTAHSQPQEVPPDVAGTLLAQAAPEDDEGEGAANGPSGEDQPADAEDGAEPEPPLLDAAPDDPADTAGGIADAAVTEWLAREPLTLESLTGLTTIDLCMMIPGLLVTPPPPAGTRVNLEDRIELDSGSPDTRLFSYSAAGAADQLQVVQVRLRADADAPGGWVVEQVGFRQPAPQGVRVWVQTPAASFVFIAFSLMVVVLLLRPSFLRRWLGMGVRVMRQHRGTYIFTLVLLYGIFAFGMFTGSQLPDECTAAVFESVSAAVTMVGATDAYGSGDIPRAAVVTFHQNFVVVTLSVLFSLALLFAIPGYLYAVFAFYVQSIPFGMVTGLTTPELLFMIVLLLLELTAYFTVVAGGGFLLVTLFRQGFGSFPQAVGKLLLMLPFALLLLLIGAWFEAAVLIGFA